MPAKALGSSVGGRALGSFGDVAVFAFYPNKQITTGEGGMVVTDDPALAEMMRSLRNQGRDADGTWLRHVRLGYNYRLDELSAALGVAQLERLGELRRGRARVARRLRARARGARLVDAPARRTSTSRWTGSSTSSGWTRRSIATESWRGWPSSASASRPYFAPLHLQPFYRATFGYQPGDFPVTERVAASTLALPFSSRLPDEDVRYVAAALAEAVA